MHHYSFHCFSVRNYLLLMKTLMLNQLSLEAKLFAMICLCQVEESIESIFQAGFNSTAGV